MSHPDRGGSRRGEHLGSSAGSTSIPPPQRSQPGRKEVPQPLNSNPPHDQATIESRAINIAGEEDQSNSREFYPQNIVSENQKVFSQRPTEKEKPLPPLAPTPTVPESELNIAKVATFQAEQLLSISRLECEELKRSVIELSELLKNAQDTIFMLQPYQQKINESDAAAAYSSLCKGVENWVESRLGNAIEDRLIFKESVFESRPANDLLNLVNSAGKDAFSCPETDEYNVTAAAMQFLVDEIFSKDFYCPVDPRGMDFLASIEKSMRNLVPNRDAATIRSWRSEALNALANRADFDSHRAERIKQLTTSLAQMLRIFIPRADRKEIQSSIKASIIERAVELAHRLQLSVDKFEVGWTEYSDGHSRHSGNIMSDAYQFECVNFLAGGKIIKFPPEGQVVQSGHITYILDIFPGLYCWSVKSDEYSEPKVLRKPKILAAMVKSNEPPFQVMPPSEANVTLLGSIHSQLQPKQRSMGFR